MSTTIGTYVKIKLAGEFFIGENSSSHAVSATAIDVSSKASGNESNFEYGRVAETGSFTSIASTNGAATEFGFKAAKEAMYAKTKVEYIETEYDAAGLAVVGAITTTGSVLITSATKDNPDNDKLSFSCDVQFDGKSVDTVNV